ncbi:MAG: carboxymuconolactone decarboxylase family protein, partial [Candidatus Binatia bacterium]
HDYRNAGLDKKDVAMLEYAEKMTLRPSEIAEKDVQRLREAGWTDREILDIAALTSYRNFITRMADALGVELTEDYKNLHQDYVRSLMVGKKLL